MPTDSTPLTESLGLVVARDVRARVDLPPFDNSSMDGYAVQSASLEGADAAPVAPVLAEVPKLIWGRRSYAAR